LTTHRGPHKLLLVEPPFYRLYKPSYSLRGYPMSLAYLAGAAIKETNWQVMAYCADFSPEPEPFKINYLTGQGFQNYLESLAAATGPVWEEVRRTIAEFHPTVIGITTKSPTFGSAKIVARIAKQIDPNIIVVLGGPHVSAVGSTAMDCPDVDICVRGEGENTLVELLQKIEEHDSFDDIKGLLFRKNGHIAETGQRPFIRDLDSLAFPLDTAPEVLKDYEKYSLEAFGFIFAARGCPYNCYFCGSRGLWTRTPRFRSVHNVISEISQMQSKGIRTVHFSDDSFGVSHEHLRALCQAIRNQCRGLRWTCRLPVKLATQENVLAMQQSGCYAVELGVESGNNEMLQRIKKDITIEEAISAAKRLRKHRIEVTATFIVGFPEETEETLRDTFQAMQNINASHITYSIFTPYPGTEAFDFCEQNGLLADDFDVARYNHQSPENCFCLHIPKDRFRALVSEVEAMVDRKTLRERRLKLLKPREVLSRIHELGPIESLKRVWRAVLP